MTDYLAEAMAQEEEEREREELFLEPPRPVGEGKALPPKGSSQEDRGREEKESLDMEGTGSREPEDPKARPWKLREGSRRQRVEPSLERGLKASVREGGGEVSRSRTVPSEEEAPWSAGAPEEEWPTLEGTAGERLSREPGEGLMRALSQARQVAGFARGQGRRLTVTLPEEKTSGGEGLSAEALDRAVERDARRYDGGFSLY